MLDILPAAIRRALDEPAVPQPGHERECLPAIGHDSPDRIRRGRDAHGCADAAAWMGRIDCARRHHDLTRRQALLDGRIRDPGALRPGRDGLEQRQRQGEQR